MRPNSSRIKKEMNHLDIFSGIGGFSLAAGRVWPDHHPILEQIARMWPTPKKTKCERSRNTWSGRSGFTNGNWWAVEPDVGRVAHGVSGRVDRLKGLGNAIVPQIAQTLMEAIKIIDEQEGCDGL